MNPVSKILLGIGAAIILIVAIAFVWLTLANAHLKTQLAEAQANATACYLANDEFTTHIAQQNKAVDQMKAAGDARLKQAQAVAAAAQKTIRFYALAADKLRGRKARGDACAAAAALIDNYRDAAK